MNFYVRTAILCHILEEKNILRANHGEKNPAHPCPTKNIYHAQKNPPPVKQSEILFYCELL